MKKSFIGILLALFIFIYLPACGGGSGSDTDSGGNGGAQEEGINVDVMEFALKSTDAIFEGSLNILIDQMNPQMSSNIYALSDSFEKAFEKINNSKIKKDYSMRKEGENDLNEAVYSNIKNQTVLTEAEARAKANNITSIMLGNAEKTSGTNN